MKTKTKLWLGFISFAILWLALRIFWLDGDAGIPSVWEYGYNVTDEGYYMGAAKDKFLWGAFNDIARNESFTYGYSALTHWISLIAYKIFGLSYWKWRIPFVLLYFIGWCLSYTTAAKRIGPFHAFCATAAFACVPVTIIYERTAGNDVTIAAIFVISYCLTIGAGVWRLFIPAIIASSIILIKPSLYLLLPILLAGILNGRKTKRWWIDATIFLVATAISIWGWRTLALLSVSAEATANGLTASDLIKLTTTHNSLPSIFDFTTIFKGISSFPRDPSFKLLSVEAAFFTIIPFAMAVRSILRRNWRPRLLIYLFVPAYIAAISANNSIYTHYFHPMMVFMPILWSEIFSDLSEDIQDSEEYKTQTIVLILTTIISIIFILTITSQIIKPREVLKYYSVIQNLPHNIVWGFNWPYLIATAIFAFILVGFLRGIKAIKKEGIAAALVALVGTSVALAGLPAVYFSPELHATKWSYIAPLLLTFTISTLFTITVFGIEAGIYRKRILVAFVPVAILISFILTPQWQTSACEILKPAKHIQRDVAQEIAKCVPEGAIVIGERSAQVLMGERIRTATTMPECNPIPIIEKLLDRDANANIYGLLDSQNAYNLNHLLKNSDKYTLIHIKTFSMPSFHAATDANVYFCKIIKTH